MKLLKEMMQMSENFGLSESVDVTEMLLKLRKNSTGFLNAKKLEIVCNAIGWKFEKKIVPIKVTDLDRATRESIGVNPSSRSRLAAHYKLDKEDFNKTGSIDILLMAHKNDATDSIFKARELEAESEITKIRSEVKKMEVSKLPVTPQKKKFYIMNISDIEIRNLHGFFGTEYSFVFDAYWSNTVFEITDKVGKKTFELSNDYIANGHSIDDFLRWAKETNWAQDILDTLKMESHESTKSAERTRENTGTCGICNKEYKLINGRLVHHGFTRPGHGYQEGDCFGVGYEPYEKSTQAIKDYVVYLNNIINSRKVRLQEIKSGKITQFSNMNRSRKMETVSIGDPAWEKTLKINIGNLDNEIEMMTADIKVYKKREDVWKEQDLPWERLSKKLKF